MIKSESIGKLSLALSKAQAEIRGAIKDAENPFYKSTYADLASVWEAIRKPMTDNELSVSQLTSWDEGAKSFVINTLITHSSGEFICGSYPLLAKDASAQAMGSATSYARRYALAAAFGVVQVDDDGEAAQKPFRAPASDSITTKQSADQRLTQHSGAQYPKCPECGTKMFPSKFKEGEFYCPNKKNHSEELPF